MPVFQPLLLHLSHPRILPIFHPKEKRCASVPTAVKGLWDFSAFFRFYSPKSGPTTKYYPLNVAPTAAQETDAPQIPDFQTFQRKYPLGAGCGLQAEELIWVSSFDAQF